VRNQAGSSYDSSAGGLGACVTWEKVARFRTREDQFERGLRVDRMQKPHRDSDLRVDHGSRLELGPEVVEVVATSHRKQARACNQRLSPAPS
jgi:hypothetical protein